MVQEHPYASAGGCRGSGSAAPAATTTARITVNDPQKEECYSAQTKQIVIKWEESAYPHAPQRMTVSPIERPARALFCLPGQRAAYRRTVSTFAEESQTESRMTSTGTYPKPV